MHTKYCRKPTVEEDSVCDNMSEAKLITRNKTDEKC